MSAIRGSALWKPKLRWLIRRMAVEALEPSVVQSEADRIEDPVAVAADGAGELDEWFEP